MLVDIIISVLVVRFYPGQGFWRLMHRHYAHAHLYKFCHIRFQPIWWRRSLSQHGMQVIFHFLFALLVFNSYITREKNGRGTGQLIKQLYWKLIGKLAGDSRHKMVVQISIFAIFTWLRIINSLSQERNLCYFRNCVTLHGRYFHMAHSVMIFRAGYQL